MRFGPDLGHLRRHPNPPVEGAAAGAVPRPRPPAGDRPEPARPPEDTAQLADGLRLCHRLATHEALADRFERIAVLDEAAFTDGDARALGDYARQFSFPWYHAAGTARMGPDPDNGDVVDDRGQVHGIDRLSVFDASILPVVPRANTNLTCIAVGERAAELLR